MATTEVETAAAAAASARWWNVLVSLFVQCKPFIFLDWAHRSSSSSSSSISLSTNVIGTILCDKMKSKLKLCFQQAEEPLHPFLILDLPISSCDLDLDAACRIVLECDRATSGDGPLLGVATWRVYFNGRRVGFARRREVVAEVGWALESVRVVSGGMGILPPSPTRTSTTKSSAPASGVNGDSGGRIFEYFRGRFERVVGSADSESYHLVDPKGCLAHHLSFFFVRL